MAKHLNGEQNGSSGERNLRASRRWPPSSPASTRTASKESRVNTTELVGMNYISSRRHGWSSAAHVRRRCPWEAWWRTWWRRPRPRTAPSAATRRAPPRRCQTPPKRSPSLRPIAPPPWGAPPPSSPASPPWIPFPLLSLPQPQQSSSGQVRGDGRTECPWCW